MIKQTSLLLVRAHSVHDYIVETNLLFKFEFKIFEYFFKCFPLFHSIKGTNINNSNSNSDSYM